MSGHSNTNLETIEIEIHRLVQDIGELQRIAGWSNQMIGG